ncbi:SRPBCC family protein [Brevundimonas sp.]|uniref:SRPBCC family protein n=1 Tax=Brevundimonas sp. TaxID=1871086 RepID=UPI002CA62BAC|nr:SRPBCC family protein [Brevundimonas sp.]HWQ87481.1 SRPBCC family protein [Brevundimonas sp.]
MTAAVVSCGLLIRRPATEVFEAFVDPAVTARFWFSEGDGRLAPGARVTWTWAMYGFTSPVTVVAFEPSRRLAVDWGDGDDRTRVEWTFEARGPDQTFVSVEQSGFTGDPDGRMAAALDGMNGFTLVLAGAKIWLEHGVEPRFVLDRHPDARVAEWRDA